MINTIIGETPSRVGSRPFGSSATHLFVQPELFLPFEYAGPQLCASRISPESPFQGRISLRLRPGR